MPTMLLQPLVENAIHHGIRGMPDGGLCEIIGYTERTGEQSNLCFIVRDNGKGMSEEENGLFGRTMAKKRYTASDLKIFRTGFN